MKVNAVDVPNHQRNWAPPKRPWTIAMTWLNLLFIHWPVHAASLKPHIPEGLELDTFDGTAWIGLVPFHMKGIRHRLLPALPGLSAFPELNVRTYVRCHDKPGVYFMSLDADHTIAVRTCRALYSLPYHDAQITCQIDDERVPQERIDFESHRSNGACSLSMSYWPTTDVYHAPHGSLDYFLTERYCLFTDDRHGQLQMAEIHHAPWPLQRANAEFRLNTMFDPFGIDVPNSKPLLHYSKYIETVAWWLEPPRSIRASPC